MFSASAHRFGVMQLESDSEKEVFVSVLFPPTDKVKKSVMRMMHLGETSHQCVYVDRNAF